MKLNLLALNMFKKAKYSYNTILLASILCTLLCLILVSQISSLQAVLSMNAVEIVSIAFTSYRIVNNTQFLVLVFVYAVASYVLQMITLMLGLSAAASTLLMMSAFLGVTLTSVWMLTKYQHNLEKFEDKLTYCNEPALTLFALSFVGMLLAFVF